MTKNLPQPTTNAGNVFGITSAIVASLFPPASIFSEMVNQHVERRFKEGQDKLIEELRIQGISAIDDPRLGYFVDASYEFFENVRKGTATYNLTLLAKIMAGEYFNKDPSSIKFRRLSKAVCDLLPEEVDVFWDAYKAESTHFPKDDRPYLSAKKLIVLCKDKYAGRNELEVSFLLSSLNANGLLMALPAIKVDDVYQNYRVSPLGHDFVSTARNQQVKAE